jgi:hypothetical protein
MMKPSKNFEHGTRHLDSKLASSHESNLSPAVLRRFALFMDGMTRAMILPFGPTLLHRLVYGGSEIQPSTWSRLSYQFAWVVAVYILGQRLGGVLARKMVFSCHRQLSAVVSRLGGAALSLYIFTYGEGLENVRWLVAIRFLSAILAGLLCGVTNGIALPEDDWLYRDNGKSSIEEERMEALRRREGYIDIASGSAKIYLTGFAVSILSGGLLFRKVTEESTLQSLTDTDRFSVSLFFLFGVAVSAEIILRCIFALTRNANLKEQIKIEKEGGVNNTNQTNDAYVYIEPFQTPLYFKSPAYSERNIQQDDENITITFTADSKLEKKINFFDAETATGARTRLESHTSVDEFFDCQSIYSDVDIETQVSDSVGLHQNEKAQYIDGKHIYEDGSHAFVPQGECIANIPSNYLAFYNNNEDKARNAWEETQKWRRERNVWRIHTMPNRWCTKIKEAYPHCFHGHSKSGHVVIYEQPGRMNLKELLRNGCEISDLIHHFIFNTEFNANCICQKEELRSLRRPDIPFGQNSWGTMVVMDVKGAGLSNLSTDVMKYLKESGDITTAHYPLTLKRVFVVNCPFWLAGAWSSLKVAIPDSVHVDILSESKYGDALREFIDEDQIPPEFGGTSPYKLGEHPYELELLKLVEELETMGGEDEVADMLDTHASNCEVPRGGDVVSRLPTIAPSMFPVRRRLGSFDRFQHDKNVSYNDATKFSSFASQYNVFLIVSVMHVLWSFVQGALEVAIPVWIVSPTIMGGIGYSPARSGVALFCACLVLLCILRARASKLLSKIPSKSPLRAFRIGAGAESALLALLTAVSSSTPYVLTSAIVFFLVLHDDLISLSFSFRPERRVDSIFVMTSTVILLASMALASMIGRSASKILHRIASESFARQTQSSNHRGAKGMLFSKCESGGVTSWLNVAAEISGIFFVAPVWSFSISIERNAPLNATCILFFTFLITFVLHVCSFSLHLNKAGEFAPHPKECWSDSRVERFFSFIWEIVVVSAADIASLFEEANWETTPLLGRDRDRTFSEASAVSLETMERGEELQIAYSGRKCV